MRAIVSPGGVALSWMVLWTLLHVLEPAWFPWIGLLAALLFIAPLFMDEWRTLRKARQEAKRKRFARMSGSVEG